MQQARERHTPRRCIDALALAAAIMVAGSVGMAGGARAQEWVAKVRGDARGAVPPQATLTVSTEDEDDVTMRLQPVIEQALRDRGYGVGENGGSGLQLWYDTQLSATTVGMDPARPENDTEIGAPVVEQQVLGYGTGAFGTEDRAEVEVTPEATVPFGSAGTAAPGQRYSLTFTVGNPGETPLWQGAVTTRIGSEDPFVVAQGMVPLLVNQIGNTVEAEQSFP